MTIRTLAAVAALCLTAPCAAGAQTVAPTPVPDVAPNFAPMAMFMGTWNCKALKTPNGRAIGHTFTSNTVMAFDARWMETDQTTPPYDQYRTRNNVSKTWLTYDPDTKMWVSMTLDNFGNYGVAMSPGWTGNTLVTTDKLNSNGQPLGVDTLTKSSDTHTHDIYAVKTSKGTQTYENDCTKAT
jgi:hypothetical protein